VSFSDCARKEEFERLAISTGSSIRLSFSSNLNNSLLLDDNDFTHEKKGFEFPFSKGSFIVRDMYIV